MYSRSKMSVIYHAILYSSFIGEFPKHMYWTAEPSLTQSKLDKQFLKNES